VQIQSANNSNLNLSSASFTSKGQNQATENNKAESLEYKIIRNKALQLLNNPDISALKKTEILNLLARGEAAAASGSEAELNYISKEIENLDPRLAINGNSSGKGALNPSNISGQQSANSVTYKDISGDSSVSFQSPVAVNKYLAPLAVQAHEEGHVIAAQARAMMNNETATSYVSIHTGYDSKGQLIITGGETITTYHQKPKIKPIQSGGKINIYA
jgi:hypothetical protein